MERQTEGCTDEWRDGKSERLGIDGVTDRQTDRWSDEWRDGESDRLGDG